MKKAKCAICGDPPEVIYRHPAGDEPLCRAHHLARQASIAEKREAIAATRRAHGATR